MTIFISIPQIFIGNLLCESHCAAAIGNVLGHMSSEVGEYLLS